MTVEAWSPIHLAGDIADAVRYAEGWHPIGGAGLQSPREQLAALEALDGVLAAGRAAIADARARVIAELAAATSTRHAASTLCLSPSAIAKAVARARALDPPAPT